MSTKSAVLVLLAATLPAAALTLPLKINFQGKLLDPATNSPKNGSVNMSFSLYNAPTGGSALYTEPAAGYTAVPVVNGVFSVQIGSNVALSRELFLGASAYLGVTVQGDSEMTPRQQLTMSAYAFSANQLSDTNEVRLIANATYSTFTAAGNFTIPGGLAASSGSFTNGVTASTITVTDNAFSVGGSSFTVAGGSATVAYAMTAGSFAGDGSALTNTTGYTIAVQALTSSPADAATVYFGRLPKAPVTVAGTSKVYIRHAGRIKVADIYCYSGTAGTAEAWSLYIRLNNTTDTLIQTLSVSANERVFTNSALSIAVNAGDYIEIKGIQPTWATNPATTIYGGYIYIE